MNRFALRQSLLLFLAATIWGTAFVAQSVGMDYVQPFTFNAVRNIVGALVLMPGIAIIGRLSRNKNIKAAKQRDKKTLIAGGIICGFILCVASSLQQFGIKYTTVGKAGFITALYIIIVPLIGLLFKKKTSLKIWIAVFSALIGLYLLCITDRITSIQPGDILLLGCAVVFSMHILAIDHFSPLVDGVKMSCIQFMTCAVISCVCMMIFEDPEPKHIVDAWFPIIYTGAISSGFAYTLQIIGQKGLDPTVASLIMSLESVVSLIAGWIILHEVLSPRELAGCLIMFFAIILVQLPSRKK